MKKLICIILAIATMLSLTSCSSMVTDLLERFYYEEIALGEVLEEEDEDEDEEDDTRHDHGSETTGPTVTMPSHETEYETTPTPETEYTEEETKPSEETRFESRTYIVEMSVENYGIIVLELDGSAAPITVENFITLVNDGFYDGLIFHRVIEDFMIQGGDPLGTGYGGSDTEIKGEFSANGVDNPISHKRGVISMARGYAFNSASSQFFICHKDSPHLDGQYAAFGHVISGIEVVDKIAAVETNASDKPLEDVVIEYIRVI